MDETMALNITIVGSTIDLDVVIRVVKIHASNQHVHVPFL